jgi:hypothetical protein
LRAILADCQTELNAVSIIKKRSLCGLETDIQDLVAVYIQVPAVVCIPDRMEEPIQAPEGVCTQGLMVDYTPDPEVACTQVRAADYTPGRMAAYIQDLAEVFIPGRVVVFILVPVVAYITDMTRSLIGAIGHQFRS